MGFGSTLFTDLVFLVSWMHGARDVVEFLHFLERGWFSFPLCEKSSEVKPKPYTFFFLFHTVSRLHTARLRAGRQGVRRKGNQRLGKRMAHSVKRLSFV